MSHTSSVNCPNCGTIVVWNIDQPHRPFCSSRCKDSDFIDWATEEKNIPGSTQYDDIFLDTNDSI